jgi:hypothetical protein
MIKNFEKKVCDKLKIRNVNPDNCFIAIGNLDGGYTIISCTQPTMSIKDKDKGTNFYYLVQKAKIEITPQPTDKGELFSIITNEKD